ncbi:MULTISPECIES: aldose epimerase family protein [unclassified Caulobacter]|uniref:aldose epimerase family protein n=1 Tax=unclassified Caulobacter TaxID=2648921 RepID=UPI0006F23C12|nr:MULTISPECIES: aldose epimerase family protein [unclassified Caulobacter]KQV57532.1 aldose epimerase [Caulobacter sp. Root342]KQV67104.1 aldose epimerase [Caulobacter sp. Root343]
MKLKTVALSSALALVAISSANAAELSRKPFGKTPSGEAVEALTLTNSHGVSATVITYGATLQSLIGPDRAGKKADIALGFADAAAYAKNASYFGASVGRFANRIGKGRFALDGKTYQLALNNNGVAALHGGVKGFDKVIWKVLSAKSGPTASVTFGYVSPDGEEGYPGTVTATATYALDEQNNLTITYGATTDKPTIVNMTNHALFNVAGEGSAEGAMGNVLTIPADGYTPVDSELIPTGTITPVTGTPFDFRTPKAVAARVRDARDPQMVIGRGYDHNYVLNGKAGGAPRLAARLADPKSGRVLEILSDQPGIQFYSGNFIDGTMVGKSGKIYRQGDGIALEPQHFPDAPNKPQFAPVRLDPGQTYRNVMVFRLTVAK